MDGRADLTDADFAHLAGVRALRMRGCTGITDAGLAHLAGIRTLDMGYCAGITDAGLAHLRGIHTLDMGGCTGITDAGLAHLRGVHTLNMYHCDGITDAGLAHLAGIHTLKMVACGRVSGVGLAQLAGVRVLDLRFVQVNVAFLGAIGGALEELDVSYDCKMYTAQDPITGESYSSLPFHAADFAMLTGLRKLGLRGVKQRHTLPPNATLGALFRAARGTLVELDVRGCEAPEPGVWAAEARSLWGAGLRVLE